MAFHRTNLSREISIPPFEQIDGRCFDPIDSDVPHAGAVTARGSNHPVPCTKGRRATGIGGPENRDYRGSETCRQLHRPRVVPHQHPETSCDSSETRDIDIFPDHRKPVLRSHAELISDCFLTGPDDDHRFVPSRT